MSVLVCKISEHKLLHTELVIGAEDADVLFFVTEKDVNFLCSCVNHVSQLVCRR